MEKAFNDGSRDAVLLAFFSVPAIPVEPDDRWKHALNMYFRTRKRQSIAPISR
jgi:hypothetical protein